MVEYDIAGNGVHQMFVSKVNNKSAVLELCCGSSGGSALHLNICLEICHSFPQYRLYILKKINLAHFQVMTTIILSLRKKPETSKTPASLPPATGC